MDHNAYGTVTLESLGPVLAKSVSVRKLLKEELGESDFFLAIKILESGNLDCKLGLDIQTLLTDAIINESKAAWRGNIPDYNGDYPVEVRYFGGAFYV